MTKDPCTSAICPFSAGNRGYSGKFGQKKSKLSVRPKTCYLDKFEYAEFNGDIPFFHFWLELPFLDKLCSKNQNCQFKLKFGS